MDRFNSFLILSSILIVGCTQGFSAITPQAASQAAAPSPSPTPLPSPSPSPSPSPIGVSAVSANTFLGSLGVNIHLSQGVSESSYVQPLQYLGVRNVRDCNDSPSGYLALHQSTGVLFNINSDCGSTGDVTGFLANVEPLAAAGALLSVEGPNEPNNFAITYNGQVGGGSSGTWTPVAEFQNAMYLAVKADSKLSGYPVFGVSEEGAETNNVGLQYLTIPAGAGAVMPDGTQYADYVNIHNYVSSNCNQYIDNDAWGASDPLLNHCWDGLEGEVGVTWGGGFNGYSASQLPTLPKVTTETGWDSVGNPGGVWVQGVVLVNVYLAQFKRGWSYTFIYQLRDGEGGNDHLGLFNNDSTPKSSATFIHNMTTILADNTPMANPGSLNYSIANEPDTVHDLLLQKSNQNFELVVWGESASATPSAVSVSLGGTHGTVNVYDVTVGTASIQTYTNISMVPLTLTDHALIVEVIN